MHFQFMMEEIQISKINYNTNGNCDGQKIEYEKKYVYKTDKKIGIF